MEPIAIIGLGVRLPGGIVDRRSAHRAFTTGTVAIRDVPADRWDADVVDRSVSGHPVPRTGAFLEGIDQFDPEPFGISPREAASLDPQQRLLLELAWEALEDAGIGPARADGSATGVYVGLGLVDWAQRTVQSSDPERIDAWSGTGAFESVAAGRISYALGLRGPAMAVQTACSSSLVAIHLACQALRAGDCTVALAGGVSVMLEPQPSLFLAELQALSPTGVCRAFDQAADGYVRGEGGGLTALKPLARAIADGDRILGVIRGSAVNQDGRATRLTAPHGKAQQAVIGAALAAAGVAPHEVAYVEAHGTGTPLGDAVELDALAAAYGPNRTRALLVGSGKAQVGHLEPAAGVAGVVRALTLLRSDTIPRQPAFDTLTARATVGDVLAVPHEAVSWPDGPRRAGVSAFGLSGTNAHVVLEAPPPFSWEDRDGPVLVAIGAHSRPALAERYGQFLQQLQQDPLAAVARASLEGRAEHRVRAALVVDRADDLPQSLPASPPPTREPALAYLFAGHGSQYPAMGYQLWESEPAYRAAVDEVEALFREVAGASLLEVLHGAEADVLRRPEWAQPALFAVEWGLAALWQAWGVHPDAVLGHSAGELTAAAVAGVIALPDAVRLATERGRFIQELSPPGRMLAIAHDADAVASALAAWPDASIAAVNAPDEVVVAATRDRIADIQRHFEALDIRVVELDVQVPFHSPLVRPVAQAFHDAVETVSLSAPTLPFFSSVTGAQVDDEVTSASYWSQQLTGTVRFVDAVMAAYDEGYDTFLELSPRRVLAAAGSRIVPDATWLGGLHPGKDDGLRCLEALSQLFVRGRRFTPRAVVRSSPWAEFPPYPFQRSRYWLDAPTGGAGRRLADVLPRYRVSWEPHLAEAGSVSGQRWIVLGNPERIGGILQRHLHEAGAQAHCTPALPEDGQHRVIWFVDPGDEPGTAATVEAVLATAASLLSDHRVTHLWAVVRAGMSDLHASALAGFGVTAALEAPQQWGGMIRLSPSLPSEAAANAIAASVTAGDDEDVVVIGRAGRTVPRLTTVVTPPTAPPELDPEARYLVTGGLGALGLSVAGLLVDLGARHLVLVSRSGPPAEGNHPTSAALSDLRDRGAKIATPAVNVTDVAGMRAVMAASERPVRGVIHAAGVAEPTEIDELDARSLAAPLSAKIDGARVLAQLTATSPLDFLVLVSSVAAVWGAERLAAYGAANRAMHALARERRREGKPGVALILGPLAAGGLVSQGDLQAFGRMGVAGMGTEEVLNAVATVLRTDTDPEVVVAQVDWDVFVPVVESRRPRPVLHRVHEPGAAASVGRGQLAYEVQQAPADQRRSLVARRVAMEVASVLGHAGAPEHRRPLAELGLDSVMAVELAERLRLASGLPLPPTVALDHHTIDALVTHLLDGFGVSSGEVKETSTHATDEPIAIVGVACRVPHASDPEHFWRLLSDGVTTIGAVPRDRWDPDEDPSYPRTGSFLDDLDQFDPEAFGITAEAAAGMDPQHRMLLELSVQALERAGIAPDSVREQRGAVFVAVGATDYPGSAMGIEPSFAAGRIADHLQLRGPTLAVNAGASGSLAAVHLACQALLRGEAAMALAGGAQTRLSPASGRGWQEEGALSTGGIARVFDEHADGVVTGEGGAMVVLKRLTHAQRDGDAVLAVIEGSAVAGGAAPVLAQHGGSQQEVLRRAIRSARIRPADVGVVEANGAGTPVTDAVEVAAMKAVYGADRDEPLRVTSLKPQVGHLGAAAGVVGLVKMVLALTHRRVPGIAALDTLNPSLPLDFPVHFPRHTEPWPLRGRHAVVHAFGMAGTQAAVVLRGPPEHHDEPLPSPGAHLLLLSAHHRDALDGVRIDVRNALKRWSVPDVASMLAHGRSAGSVRLAVVGHDADRLRHHLQHPDTDGVPSGSLPRVGFLFGGAEDLAPGVAAEVAAADAPLAALLARAIAAVPDELLEPDSLSRFLLDPRSDEAPHLRGPAAVVLGWALAERWAALGVRPTAVVGHGAGELAAAAAAGVLSLEQALHLAAVRTEADSVRWLLVTTAPWDGIAPLLEDHGSVEVAAVDHAERHVLTGPREALRDIGTYLRDQGWPSDPVAAEVAGLPAPDAVRRAARAMDARPPRTVLVSTVDGEAVSEMGPDHWVQHANGPVRFRDAVRSVAERCDVMVELSSRPRLGPWAALLAPEHLVLPTLEPPRAPRVRFLQTAGALWERGLDLHPDGLLGRRTPIPLPPVPFTRVRCWSSEAVPQGVAPTEPIYTLQWHRTDPAANPLEGRVLLVESEDGAFGPSLVERWRAQGIRVHLIHPGEPIEVADHVVGLQLDGPEALRTLQAVVTKPGVRPRLWWATRGAVAVDPDEPVDARQAALWGLAATAALEEPDAFGGIIDLDPEGDAEGLLDAIALAAPRTAVRSGELHTPRIRPLATPERVTSWLDTDHDIVVGGDAPAALGLVRWALRGGASRVWWLCPASPADDVAAELDDLGAWTWLPVDLADRAQVKRGLGRVRAEGAPLGSVFCVPPALDAEAPLVGADVEAWEAQWRAGLAPVLPLHDLTAVEEPFVLFTDVVGWLGASGRGLAASVAATLDGVVRHRVARGRQGLVLSVGPSDPSPDDDGIRPMPVDEVLAALEHLDPSPRSVAIVHADWAEVARRSRYAVPELFRGLPGVPERAALPGEGSALVVRLRQLRPSDRQDLLEQVVSAQAEAVRGPGEELGAHRGLIDAGLDALALSELARRLGRLLDLPIPQALMLEHGSVASLTGALLEALSLVPHPDRSADDVPLDAPVAVVGMACRYPGGVDSPEALWGLLTSGRSTIGEIPPDRWDVDAWYAPPPAPPGRSYARHGAFLDHVDLFDPEFFDISPREAAALDPQQRLLLEVCWEALERAGMATAALRGRRVGVFVGIAERGYHLRGGRPVDRFAASGGGAGFAATRIAHTFGLTGPAVGLDTHGSASLVAIHHASRALAAGDCDVALAGGVSLMLRPEEMAALCALGALSVSGRSLPFDAGADGAVRGEGCGMVVLERLDDADRNGESVLAVIRGSAVAHDGPSAGLLAPSGHGQEQVLREALARAEARSWDVGVLEAHGGGSRVGDAVEVRAAESVLGDRRDRGPVWLGSAKAQLGHTEHAAGVAGVLKAVLMLQHGTVPPQPLRELNPSFGLTGLAVPDRPSPLPAGTRYAMVSAFGMSGTNAAVLLGEGHGTEVPAVAKPDRPVHLLALSARTDTALQAWVGRLRPALARANLADLAATVHRRRAFEVRAAVVAADAHEAAERITSIRPTQIRRAPRVGLYEGTSPVHVVERLMEVWPFERTPDSAGAAIRTLFARWGIALRDAGTETDVMVSVGAGGPEGALPALGMPGDDPATGLVRAVAELFSRGCDVDWTAWDAPWARRPVTVPTTPFDRRRFWIEEGRQVDWTYRLRWVEPPSTGDLPRSVVLVGPGAAAEVATLRAHGIAATVAEATTVAPGSFVIDLRWAAADRAPEAVWGVLELARRLGSGTLCVVTRRGVAIRDEPVDPVAAALWGAVRSLSGEGGARVFDTVPGRLVEALQTGEPEVAIRDEQVWVPRLERIDLAVAAPALSGRWWLTGGLGVVGTAVAEWLADAGVRHLVLPTRKVSELDAAVLESLRTRGLTLHPVEADVTDPDDMQDLLRRSPPDGVVHAARVVVRHDLAHVTAPDVARALHAHAEGAEVLDTLLADQPLQAMVFFSSVAGVLGRADAVAWAASAAMVDGIAQRRAARRLPALSVAWGSWTGDAAGRGGLRPMPASGALDALGAALAAGRSWLVVARIDWDQFVGWRPMVEGFVPAPRRAPLPERFDLPPPESVHQALPPGGWVAVGIALGVLFTTLGWWLSG